MKTLVTTDRSSPLAGMAAFVRATGIQPCGRAAASTLPGEGRA